MAAVSHIPTPINHQYLPGRTTSAPSKLEQLRDNFQAKLLKEKERKLIALYNDNQDRALHRVHAINGQQHENRSVREFFKERRNVKKESPSSLNSTYALVHKNSGNQRSYHSPHSAGSNNSKQGRDRANPLDPIEPDKKANRQKSGNSHRSSKSTRTSPNEKRLGSKSKSRSPHEDDDEDHTSQKMTGFQSWKMKQQSRRQVNEAETKKSDYQKWQEEQDLSREQRLKNYHDKTKQNQYEYESPRQDYKAKKSRESKKSRKSSINQYQESSSEEELQSSTSKHSHRSYASSSHSMQRAPSVEDELMTRKQQELMSMIEKQRAELAKMQQDRAAEEIKEKERQRKEEEREREWQKKEEERERKMRQMDEEHERLQKQKQEEEELMSKKAERQRRSKREAEKRVHKVEKVQPSPPQERKQQKSRPAKVKSKKWVPPPSSPTENSDDAPLPKQNYADFYAKLAEEMDDGQSQPVKLKECDNCGRKFAADRLVKHAKACKGMKDRKKFDVQKMRSEGTDVAKYVEEARYQQKKKEAPKRSTKQSAGKSDWKRKHEEFINTIRYAKKLSQIEAEGGNLADLPPPPRSENPDYVQCPHCSRKFNQGAAERHIPKCKDYKFNKKRK